MRLYGLLFRELFFATYVVVLAAIRLPQRPTEMFS